MQVSVDQDTPVLFTYHYDSGANAGQACTQTAQCSAGAPNTVQNTQCGASTGSTPSAASAKTYSNTTIPIVQSTVPVITSEVVYNTVTSRSQTIAYTKGSYTSFDIVPTMSSVIITSTKTFCTRCVAPPMTESPTIQSTVVFTGGPSSAGQASVRTITSSAPVELAKSSSSPPSSAPASPAQAAPAPSLLPNCIQTWIKHTNCKDNSDAGCFCKDSDFTSNVQQCISAWSSHAAEEQGALSYLAGICAPQIPANPGIVTNVPKTITLAPVPVPTNSSNPATPIVAGATQQARSSPPQTTVSISTTVTIPCPSSGATSIVNQISDGQIQSMCMTTSILNTAVAVPQVAFITSNSAVGLIAGTPAPTAAFTTAINLPIASAVTAPPIAPAVAPAVTLAATPASGFASGSGTSFIGPMSTGVVPFTGEGFKLAVRSFVALLVATVAAMA
ncbi:hypothetical protein OEA41_005550 [Lepraria neglecta]|uniref:CFEM domain-containing protein n=1 Tax=Lepraria neglecta TaxID=209136 RepID=A0AAD9ZI13_9LECA|nr:hypothetical protein OEA41_005550 [Lepraria neglecta]